MTAHSKGGQSWSTKLARIGALSASRKEIVFNNLGHVIDFSMLSDMFGRLDGKKAVGIDGVTKEEYGQDLKRNLESLLRQIRQGGYRPQPSQITEIPKEDGSKRPLAIACLEDKIVQSAVAAILNGIFEPLFLDCSFGYRPKRNCHQALRSLARQAYQNQDGAIVEIDIRRYFNSIPHQGLETFLRRKISDRRFLNLVRTLMRPPVVENGSPRTNKLGCPQGSIVSPILANVFLHYVIDEWFASISSTHLRGRCGMVRLADDMVFTFEHRDVARRFFDVLPKRLRKHGLEIHPEKSHLLPAGNFAAQRASRKGERLPVFNFLGFTCYWGKALAGHFWRLKVSTRRDRFTAKLKALRVYLWERRSAKDTDFVLRSVARVVRGWVNYHAVSDNQRRVNGFLRKCTCIVRKWFHRRGGRKYWSWSKIREVMRQSGFPETFKTTSLTH